MISLHVNALRTVCQAFKTAYRGVGEGGGGGGGGGGGLEGLLLRFVVIH